MNKEEKTAVVEKLTEELKGAEAVFAIDYRGISVPQAAELRAGLRDADTRFRVVKNRLTLRAADAAGTDEIKGFLTGPTALALVEGDVALAAKTISKLGGEWELLEYKGGIMDGAALDPEQFVAIAKLPGRDQLNAQFAGIVASPLTGLVRGLGSMISGLASQLQQMADQGLVTGEAPAPAAEEAPAAEGESPEEPSGDSAAPATASQPDTPAGEAEEVGGDDGQAGSQDTTSEASEPDPEPTESPEEEPSEEEAPEGESAGEGAEADETGEGDQDLGEEPSDEPAGETTKETESSEASPADPGSEAEESAEDESKENE